MERRLAALAILAWTTSGCIVSHPRRPPPRVVVVAPHHHGHVPPGQIRSAEVHERNAARKAAHDAEKAEKKRGKHHGHGHDD
jgi:hypothetical protein